MHDRTGSAGEASRFAGRAFLIIALIIFVVGCSKEAAPEEETAQPETVVEEAPEAENVEVVDDERSLERRIEDAAIATQVRIALVDASELRRFEFHPEVVNGRVVLRGEVNTQNQRSRAEAVAKEVQGVQSVNNQITALEEPVVASETPDTAAADTAEGIARADQPADTAQDPDASERDIQTQTDETAAKSESESAQQQATYHTVKSGESLWTISRNYDVTIEQIRRLNNLSSNNLRPGQRLQVK